MSDRTINYYEFPNGEPDWAKLKRLFNRNISKHNVPFFEVNSEMEREFLWFCEASNISTYKKTIIEYDGKTTESEGFLYLVVKDDNGACVAEDQKSFLDLSAACPGGGIFGTCGRGAKQVDRVSVMPEGVEQVTKLGLLSTKHPNVPKIYLLSTVVADALRTAGATGIEIVPTDTSHCYQLRIIAETIGRARIGQARMGKRCPVCGVAKLFFGNSERCFHPGDLKALDFQNCRSYQADNVGQFEILNGFPIVSQRIFNLLLGLRIRGLGRYSTDPPIQHAIVQVCNP
jgi:hypothetical protein